MNIKVAHLWLDGFKHANVHECDLALEGDQKQQGLIRLWKSKTFKYRVFLMPLEHRAATTQLWTYTQNNLVTKVLKGKSRYSATSCGQRHLKQLYFDSSFNQQ